MGQTAKQQTHAATHHFTRNNLCRGSEKGRDAVSCAATHIFERKTVYRDSRIQEKQMHNAATLSFQRNTLYRGRNYITKAYIHAATHLFRAENLYRDSRIQEKQMHNAATNFSERITCISIWDRLQNSKHMQRHTILHEITCVATQKRGEMQ